MSRMEQGVPWTTCLADSWCRNERGEKRGRRWVQRSRTRAEVEGVVDDLIARYGSFPASAVSERVASVGERTVRRYLADMVREGKLVSVPRGRSTTYRAGNSADGLSGDC